MKKILVVDDEVHILELVSERLRESGYDVVEASDGLQAVQLAHSAAPDLIVLDVKLPAGGGVGVYENLKMAGPTARIPILFFTAYPTEEVMKRIEEGGAYGYVTKPFKMEDLLGKIRKIIGA